MSKPEDIPEEVWGTAFDHMDCHCPEAMMGDDSLQTSVHRAIARAIMAAKAEEREACVQIVFGSYRNHTARCSRIVRAIRKRGES